MNKLALEKKKRKGSKNQTEREFIDFIVDGISLSEKLGDYVSGIGCFLPGESEKVIKRLLLEDEADFDNGRRSLYVCPECGDLGCGAVSIVIEKSDDKVIWKDFAREYDYSDDLSEYNWLGPFVFDWKEYKKTLSDLL